MYLLIRASATELLLLLSLKPHETVSTCASKLKGQVSKWLRARLGLAEPAKLLSRGYFACTTGKSNANTVEQYLSDQGQHHGYEKRARPPLLVQRFVATKADEGRTQAKHAQSSLQFHIVLATWRRQGIFGSETGRAIAQRWRSITRNACGSLIKVSFVPDHVHLALRLHPAAAPAELIVTLMNDSQEFMWNRFGDCVARAGIERLWQSSAYLGSYGDLASAQISKYIRKPGGDI